MVERDESMVFDVLFIADVNEGELVALVLFIVFDFEADIDEPISGRFLIGNIGPF